MSKWIKTEGESLVNIGNASHIFIEEYVPKSKAHSVKVLFPTDQTIIVSFPGTVERCDHILQGLTNFVAEVEKCRHFFNVKNYAEYFDNPEKFESDT